MRKFASEPGAYYAEVRAGREVIDSGVFPLKSRAQNIELDSSADAAPQTQGALAALLQQISQRLERLEHGGARARESAPNPMRRRFRAPTHSTRTLSESLRLRDRAALSSKRSPATVNRELAVLSAILTLAVDDELIPENPCRKVKAMRTDNTRNRYLSEEEKLLAALESEQWLRSIVIMAMHTGMRRSEIFKLRWFDVDFTRGLIRVRNTKTGKDRDVPMNATVRKMLDGQPRSSGHVFPSPKTGGQLVDIKHKFDNARVAAKIVDFRFHDLRHTAATRLADAKANIVVIAEILGHGDIRTTKRCSHAMDEAKREAVEKLAGTGASGQNPAKKARKEKRQAGRLTVS